MKNGLTNEEVIINRKKYGTNEINKTSKNSFWHLLIESLGDPIIKILLIALGVKTIFLIKDFDWYETVGIVIAIFLASFISTISEYGSEKAFDKLQEESSKIKCKVKRNGTVVSINLEEVVYDDIVILEVGDKIPADGVIIDGEIGVDESSINGESKEIWKKPLTDNIMQENNKVFRGTTVYSKKALMLVTSVGINTFYGKLALDLQVKNPDSPLKLRLRKLATIISKIGYIAAFLVSFSYLFNVIVISNGFDLTRIIAFVTNYPILIGHILHALTLSVTVIVVAVPEGLPMMITLVLSSNMKRMLKNNVLVRKLVGIETAGSLNVLFTDKTGTLTKGKLELIDIVSANLKHYNNEDSLRATGIYEIIKASLVYNNASTYDLDGNIIGGNITDRALLKFINTPIYKIKKDKEIPFDSKNKYSITTINGTNLIKGAPEKILPFCNSYYKEDGDINSLFSKKEINKLIFDATNKGIRVLAFATSKGDNYFSKLALACLAFIKDDIRSDAKEGVDLVKAAGIQTIMITGDNKDTAYAIGKEAGIIDENDIVLTSEELDTKTDEEIKMIFPKLKVIARALPSDKSRMVRIAEEMGLVVGMTGDGVNDAPALKKADVGFSMGSGTEVAKEASDIVILDDNFLSISKAILYGRTIFKSIRKFIIFQLTVNLCAVSVSIIGPFICINTPVTVIQMLWINMVMDTLAGLAYSFEPALKEYMEEKPKAKNESIINRYMIEEILFTGTYSSILCIAFLKLPFIKNLFRYSPDNIYILTAFFGLFIFIGIFNSFNARTNRLNIFSNLYKNKIFLLIIAFITIVQISLIYFGGSLFRTSGLTIKEFIIMINIAITVIPIDYIRKIFFRHKQGITGV